MNEGSIHVGHGTTPIWIATEARARDLTITATSDEQPHCGGPAGDPTISDIRITDRGFGFTVTVPGAVATVTWRYDLETLEERFKYWLGFARNEVAAAVLVLAEVQQGQPSLPALKAAHQGPAATTDTQVAVNAVRDLLGLAAKEQA